MKEVIYYSQNNNKIPFYIWYQSLDNSYKLIVDKRISNVERGLYGDFKRLTLELSEFKFTNGLRIYFMETVNQIILLLTGGNKARQNKDIEIAKKYIEDYKERLKL